MWRIHNSLAPVEEIDPQPTFNGPQRSAVLKRLMAYIYARNTRLRKANDGLSTGIKKRYSLSPLGFRIRRRHLSTRSRKACQVA